MGLFGRKKMYGQCFFMMERFLDLLVIFPVIL